MKVSDWKKDVIDQAQIDKYLTEGNDFICEKTIKQKIQDGQNPTDEYINQIIEKALSVKTLAPEETAALLNVTSEKMWDKIFKAALELKKKVYDNRIVFFAPLYCSNLCVNNCEYCGFREKNCKEKRAILTPEEIKRETKSVLNEGHKRLILVFGEHPKSDIDYMEEAIKSVYEVHEKAPKSGKETNIRRVNINAAPMSIEKLRRLKEAGIGTFQVFQETYHKETYARVHPKDTIKGNYRWRLYALHRAMDAGLDDVAIGALFGLYDWKFEVMGLLYHTLELEKRYGVGPHTISVPRITPASESELSENLPYQVNDEDFKKIVAVLRLSVPTAGLIVTAREKSEIKREIIKLGCTQTDASTRIGIGGYSDQLNQEKQQFTIGDPRDLDDVIQEILKDGFIPSFCTAGYRCGRTGETIMGMLSHCVEGKFCKLNGVLTFREYLNDYASEETKVLGEKIIQKELGEIYKEQYFVDHPKLIEKFDHQYKEISSGKRDRYI